MPPSFWDVFNLLSILYAVMSGIILGSTFLLYISLKFPPLKILALRYQIPLSFIILSSLGAVFFAGQVTQAILSGDTQVPRILGRLALWFVFALSVSISHAYTRSFAKPAKDDNSYVMPNMEQRLNNRADVRAMNASAVADDTNYRVTDVQKRVSTQTGPERRSRVR